MLTKACWALSIQDLGLFLNKGVAYLRFLWDSPDTAAFFKESAPSLNSCKGDPVRRGRTGKLEITTTGGEAVRAFVPDPLPPAPPVQLEGSLNRLFEQSLLSLGRLDNITTLLPDTALFLYTYVRKEAVLSSQIEGTQSSLSDLLFYELEEVPGVPIHDAQEVALYVAALNHGLKRLRDGFPVSNRLIREIHGVLLSGGRGSDKSPGVFRRSQNWVGGTRPGNAVYVPPPPQHVIPCMSDLERYLHAKKRTAPVLIKAALAHVQFETIHPFLDGNGRVGRLIITFLLCAEGVLQDPLLYLSLYFKQNRTEYYRLLGQVREVGDWEEWIEFFLTGIRETADGAVTTAQRLIALFEEDRKRIQQQGRAAGSGLRVHEALKQRPILSQPQVAEMTQLSPPTVAATLRLLERMGIARELTNRKRNKLFGYTEYLSHLAEGTEPISTDSR